MLSLLRPPDARVYRSTRAEQETVIRWDRDADQMHIWSTSPVTWCRMECLGLRPVRETTIGGQPAGRFYQIPVSRFRWGLKRAGAKAPGRRVTVRSAA
jgi:hypothetical protein